MINSKAVEIAGKTINIRELTVRDIMTAPEQLNSVTAEGVPYLLMRCMDCSIEDIADFSFSELHKLETAFMDINKAFFLRAGRPINLPA